ncbi:suppressor of tub2 mutation [Agyrium rufum]|nr:suppressor of tub2 mutation [Agyrium rufum]
MAVTPTTWAVPALLILLLAADPWVVLALSLLTTVTFFLVLELKTLRSPLRASIMESISFARELHVDEAFRDMMPCFEGKETEANWPQREKNVLKMRRITKGNAPVKYTSAYLSGIKTLLDGILKNVSSVRTTLSSTTCLLVQEVAQTAGTGIDPMVEIMMQTLLKLCGNTKVIFANNGNATVAAIMKHATYNIRLLQHILTAASDRNMRPRLFAAEWLRLIIDRTASHKHVLELNGGLDLIDKIFKKGFADKDPKVRDTVRDTYWAFWKLYKSRAEAIVATLDGKQQELVMKHSANPSLEQTSNTVAGPEGSKHSKSVSRPTTPHQPEPAKSSIKEQIRAARLAKECKAPPTATISNLDGNKDALAMKHPVRHIPEQTSSIVAGPEVTKQSKIISRPTTPHHPESAKSSIREQIKAARLAKDEKASQTAVTAIATATAVQTVTAASTATDKPARYPGESFRDFMERTRPQREAKRRERDAIFRKENPDAPLTASEFHDRIILRVAQRVALQNQANTPKAEVSQPHLDSAQRSNGPLATTHHLPAANEVAASGAAAPRGLQSAPVRFPQQRSKSNTSVSRVVPTSILKRTNFNDSIKLDSTADLSHLHDQTRKPVELAVPKDGVADTASEMTTDYFLEMALASHADDLKAEALKSEALKVEALKVDASIIDPQDDKRVDSGSTTIHHPMTDRVRFAPGSPMRITYVWRDSDSESQSSDSTSDVSAGQNLSIETSPQPLFTDFIRINRTREMEKSPLRNVFDYDSFESRSEGSERLEIRLPDHEPGLRDESAERAAVREFTPSTPSLSVSEGRPALRSVTLNTLPSLPSSTADSSDKSSVSLTPWDSGTIRPYQNMSKQRKQAPPGAIVDSAIRALANMTIDEHGFKVLQKTIKRSSENELFPAESARFASFLHYLCDAIEKESYKIEHTSRELTRQLIYTLRLTVEHFPNQFDTYQPRTYLCLGIAFANFSGPLFDLRMREELCTIAAAVTHDTDVDDDTIRFLLEQTEEWAWEDNHVTIQFRLAVLERIVVKVFVRLDRPLPDDIRQALTPLVKRFLATRPEYQRHLVSFIVMLHQLYPNEREFAYEFGDLPEYIKNMMCYFQAENLRDSYVRQSSGEYWIEMAGDDPRYGAPDSRNSSASYY